MGLTLAVVLFFALFVVWVALPLLPALVELRRRADVKPLRVVRASDVDIRHFANSFHAWVQERLGESLAGCRAAGTPVAGKLEDGIATVALPDGATVPLARDGRGPATCRSVVAGCGSLKLTPGALYPLEIYAAGSIAVGERAVCRAILAEGDLQLGRACWSLRWLHARVSLLAREECALHGRASANISMRLEAGCRFERLNAPTIAFGVPQPLTQAAVPHAELTAREVPDLVEDAAGRWLVRKFWEIPAGRLVNSDIVVMGPLTIGAGTRIVGSVKSHGDLVLGAGVEVDGSIVSGRDLRVGRGCRVRGPVIAEREARIGAGARLGTAERPTTLSVRQLWVETGAVVHGTVWAHGGGLVVAGPGAAAPARAPASATASATASTTATGVS